MNWGGSTLWFIGRGSGLIAEVLLTTVVVLGALSAAPGGLGTVRRRVITQGLHRQLTLAGVVILVVHITSMVLDQYVDLDLVDVVVPFGSSYRTIWLGLGTRGRRPDRGRGRHLAAAPTDGPSGLAHDPPAGLCRVGACRRARIDVWHRRRLALGPAARRGLRRSRRDGRDLPGRVRAYVAPARAGGCAPGAC